MNEQPTHIDLFAGIGGFSLAFESEGFTTVAFSEINPDKCLVYQRHFHGVPNLGDIKAITANTFGRVDVLTGGVPCQPASALGQMRGSADERWLWPEALRMVSLFRPSYAVFENPPSLLVLEGGRAWNGIVSGLAARGYDCWWDVLPAAAFGAGHLRERVILIASDGSWQRANVGLLLRENLGRIKPPQDSETSWQDKKGIDSYSACISQRIEANKNHAEGPSRKARTCVAGVDDFKPVGVGPNADRSGLQRHSGNGENLNGGARAERSIAAPDLRGRVRDFGNNLPWWHEANTAIPVLADGLPTKLVEAAARCAGDAVVPQVIKPIARAIYQQLI